MNEQYSYMKDLAKSGVTSLGLVTNATWKKDSKRLGFTLARYKFVSKMLYGRNNALEVGCGDGWASKIVADSVNKLSLTDYDSLFVDDAKKNTIQWGLSVNCFVHDFLESHLPPGNNDAYDSAFALDVLEHISPDKEDLFINNIKLSCRNRSIIIFGMPSLESQYTIDPDKRDPGHINCKSQTEFIKTMNRHFDTVLPFSMNDEVLHVGYSAMSQYLFCIGIS